MVAFFQRLRTIGWAAVEAAFVLIVLCILLNIIIGGETDSFIATVAKNATNFLNSLPPGVVLGVALIVLLYFLIKSRLPQ
ncbi:MAG TPA: hypothetical protein VHO95_02555 [Candidatus Dormibacteraeota bacterium]|nr:hypothetical protein [Candidatus Dormibacteraeota bacterium]